MLRSPLPPTSVKFENAALAVEALADCPEKQRPKLREAIVEAMLWARQQP